MEPKIFEALILPQTNNPRSLVARKNYALTHYPLTVNQKTEEAKTNNGKSIDLSIFEPALQVFKYWLQCREKLQ